MTVEHHDVAFHDETGTLLLMTGPERGAPRGLAGILKAGASGAWRPFDFDPGIGGHPGQIAAGLARIPLDHLRELRPVRLTNALRASGKIPSVVDPMSLPDLLQAFLDRTLVPDLAALGYDPARGLFVTCQPALTVLLYPDGAAAPACKKHSKHAVWI